MRRPRGKREYTRSLRAFKGVPFILYNHGYSKSGKICADISLSRLVVKKSNLPRAGRGLFTLCDIPKGKRVVEYTGTYRYDFEGTGSAQAVCSVGMQELHENHDYCYELLPNVCIDAAEITEQNKGRFINDLNHKHPFKKRPNNLTWSVCKNTCQVFLVSTKFIPKHSELGVSYGRGYWRTRQ